MTIQKISKDVLLEKYAKGDETKPAEIFQRVAVALAAVEKSPSIWSGAFREALDAGFVPAGRIMSAAGTDISATLINCFVQPVADSVSEAVDGKPSIYQALAESAETMRRGGGVGYDFSAIRPKGAKVKGTASNASGPISYMRVFDRSCETVESAGSRRGAQMGILRCDHPDIELFVHAKDTRGELRNFNLSVGVTDALMEAVIADTEWQLVHQAEPGAEHKHGGAFRRDDGVWVYSVIKARELWNQIMRSTYDHAEPGVVFIDRMNAENNLHYCESLEATNPCGEQPLPSYGCCCLGSIDLTRFVASPFTSGARFDFDRFGQTVRTAIRMLDNVLDVTHWPLENQRAEAASKRRVGLGFTGLGDALIMLRYRYDRDEARQFASSAAAFMRDEAYRTSIELAKEKGAFPLFDAERYLNSGFAVRLPEDIREAIRDHGIRNSHLLSIAPTGTISLAFCDNASNGIEPPFSWTYTRKKRTADGSTEEYAVEDHAYRLNRKLGGDVCNLPNYWVTALEIAALDHMRMLQAVQPFVDSAISKTVNVPADYPFEDFEHLYMEAWKAGLKGLATYRPNDIVGQVLVADAPIGTLAASTTTSDQGGSPDFDGTDPDRRIRLDSVPEPALESLRWRKRPRPSGGNPAWCYMVDHPNGSFAVFVGHLDNGKTLPFEVWINGAEQPRGLGALAKSLSMDLRSSDHGWMKAKLESLMKAHSDDGFDLILSAEQDPIRVPSLVAGFARLVYHRCTELHVFDFIDETPILNALMSPKEPKTGTDGTMSWTVDILNIATGDDFVMGVKELILPNGTRRPYSVWLSGEYPRVLDGLCKSLSFDMRVLDPAWIGAKLRQLVDFPEPHGDFMAWVPDDKRQQRYPSTVAYVCRLLIHRYAMLGVLDEEGYPLEDMGLMHYEADNVVPLRSHSVGAMEVHAGRCCRECGNYAVIRKDGCDFCTACGAIGACG